MGLHCPLVRAGTMYLGARRTGEEPLAPLELELGRQFAQFIGQFR
jgi:hypothetical protein